MRVATLKKGNPIWSIGNLKGLSLPELNSCLDQISSEPNAPATFYLEDVGESWGIADLNSKGARQSLWNKL